MTSPTPQSSAHTAEVRIADRLAALWQRQRPVLAERIVVLERAAEAAADASLTPELRAEAAMLAHKLAGTLGLYGHAAAGKAASKMELLLDVEEPLNGPELQSCAAELRRVLAL